MAARITESEFLKRARERFGDHFDYSEIKYRSYKSPVKIRCNHHPVQLINITASAFNPEQDKPLFALLFQSALFRSAAEQHRD